MTAIGQRGARKRLAAPGDLPSTCEPDRTPQFRYVRGRSYAAVAVAELEAGEIDQAVKSPESSLEDPATIVVKRGRSALIVKKLFRRSEGETWSAYKRYGSKTWTRRVARGLQSPRAVKSFYLGHQLLQRGIATARPLLAASPTWRAILRPGFLATEWLEGAVPIDVFLRTMAGIDHPGRAVILRETASRIGQLVGTLHARGFAHRDLKSTNLLVRERCGQVEAFVIDLDGVTQPWFLTRRTRMSNLARLVDATHGSKAVTRCLRRRALAAYLSSASDAADWKTVWKQLGKISRIRRSRKAALAR